MASNRESRAILRQLVLILSVLASVNLLIFLLLWFDSGDEEGVLGTMIGTCDNSR
jgi:hypothetical protein